MPPPSDCLNGLLQVFGHQHHFPAFKVIQLHDVIHSSVSFRLSNLEEVPESQDGNNFAAKSVNLKLRGLNQSVVHSDWFRVSPGRSVGSLVVLSMAVCCLPESVKLEDLILPPH